MFKESAAVHTTESLHRPGRLLLFPDRQLRLGTPTVNSEVFARRHLVTFSYSTNSYFFSRNFSLSTVSRALKRDQAANSLHPLRSSIIAVPLLAADLPTREGKCDLSPPLYPSSSSSCYISACCIIVCPHVGACLSGVPRLTGAPASNPAGTCD